MFDCNRSCKKCNERNMNCNQMKKCKPAFCSSELFLMTHWSFGQSVMANKWPHSDYRRNIVVVTWNFLRGNQNNCVTSARFWAIQTKQNKVRGQWASYIRKTILKIHKHLVSVFKICKVNFFQKQMFTWLAR